MKCIFKWSSWCSEGAFVVGNVVGMGLGSSTDGVIVVDAFVGHYSATSAGMAGGSNVGCC